MIYYKATILLSALILTTIPSFTMQNNFCLIVKIPKEQKQREALINEVKEAPYYKAHLLIDCLSECWATLSDLDSADHHEDMQNQILEKIKNKPWFAKARLRHDPRIPFPDNQIKIVIEKESNQQQ